jgi:hypothetical protein
LVQFQNDLADVTLRAEGILSGIDLAEWIGFGDQWGNVAAFDQFDKVSKNLRFQNSAAEKAQILEVKRTHVQLDKRTPNRASDGVAAARAQDIHKRRPFRAGDKINDNIDLPRAEGRDIICIPV